MKLRMTGQQAPARKETAFTLIEVIFAVAVMAVMFISLYLGFTQGFAVIQVARENLRATQILLEKAETVRLYNWDQINTAGFIPSTFTASFYPAGTSGQQGITYSGTTTITNSPFSESYSNLARLVIFRVNWISGNIQRQRQMTTLVATNGLQNYIYN
jgi:prepilin-type N-terminal cleavage/methylation domain-containing protein